MSAKTVQLKDTEKYANREVLKVFAHVVRIYSWADTPRRPAEIWITDYTQLKQPAEARVYHKMWLEYPENQYHHALYDDSNCLCLQVQRKVFNEFMSLFEMNEKLPLEKRRINPATSGQILGVSDFQEFPFIPIECVYEKNEFRGKLEGKVYTPIKILPLTSSHSMDLFRKRAEYVFEAQGLPELLGDYLKQYLPTLPGDKQLQPAKDQNPSAVEQSGKLVVKNVEKVVGKSIFRPVVAEVKKETEITTEPKKKRKEIDLSSSLMNLKKQHRAAAGASYMGSNGNSIASIRDAAIGSSFRVAVSIIKFIPENPEYWVMDGEIRLTVVVRDALKPLLLRCDEKDVQDNDELLEIKFRGKTARRFLGVDAKALSGSFEKARFGGFVGLISSTLQQAASYARSQQFCPSNIAGVEVTLRKDKFTDEKNPYYHETFWTSDDMDFEDFLVNQNYVHATESAET